MDFALLTTFLLEISDTFQIGWFPERLLEVLPIMIVGMLGVFVVIGAIMLIMKLLIYVFPPDDIKEKRIEKKTEKKAQKQAGQEK